jgi:hypothetical protein
LVIDYQLSVSQYLAKVPACQSTNLILPNQSDNAEVAFKVATAAVPAQRNLDTGASDETKLRTYLKTKSNTIPQLIVHIGNMVSATTHPLAADIGRVALQQASNSIVLVSLTLTYIVAEIWTDNCAKFHVF